jgi:MFS family permease
VPLARGDRRPLGPVRPLVVSYLLVGSAEWSLATALSTAVYDATQSSGWVGAVVAARFLPTVVAGPLAGVLADRVDRRWLVVWSCALRAALMAVAAAVATGAPPALLLGVAVMDSVLVAPFRPAALALVPGLAGTAGLYRANAAIGVAIQVTWVVGPALGALTTLAVSPAFTFAVTGAILVAAAWSATRIQGDTKPGAISVDVPRSMLQMSRDGVTALAAADGALALVALMVAVECVFGFELVAHVSVAAERLDLGAAGVGWLTAFVGLGGVFGAGAATRAARGRHAGVLLAAAGAGFGATMAVLATLTSPVLAFGLMLAEGLANVVYDVLTITLLQRLLAGGLLARGQAFIDTLGAVALTVGSLSAPVVIGIAGLPGALVAAGGAMVLVAAGLGPKLAAVDRATAARIAELAPVTDCFRASALFATTPYPVVERLAAVATATTVASGTVVVEQGDIADAVHIVESGRLTVSRLEGSADVVVNELRPGDWFGEIGVVHHTTRTATVTTRTDAQLWSIPADAFLATVDGTRTVAEPLRCGIRTRLARTHPHLVD